MLDDGYLSSYDLERQRRQVSYHSQISCLVLSSNRHLMFQHYALSDVLAEANHAHEDLGCDSYSIQYSLVTFQTLNHHLVKRFQYVS